MMLILRAVCPDGKLSPCWEPRTSSLKALKEPGAGAGSVRRAARSRGETSLATGRLGAGGRILQCGPAVPASTCALTHDFRK